MVIKALVCLPQLWVEVPPLRLFPESGGGFHQSSNSHCLVSFGPLITPKHIAFIQRTHMCLRMHLVWLSKRWFALYSCPLGCLRWDIFRRGGGIASIFKQPLLGKFWSLDLNKKHSIHPINSCVFIHVFSLVTNLLFCHLQLWVSVPLSRLFQERGGDCINLQTATAWWVLVPWSQQKGWHSSNWLICVCGCIWFGHQSVGFLYTAVLLGASVNFFLREWGGDSMNLPTAAV